MGPDYYSIWPTLLSTGLLVLLAATPLLSAADSIPSVHKQRRINSLDGLRGFLALAVFFHHAAIYHGFLMTGVWKTPPSNFYRVLGPVGVMSFFMITSYLFWSKLVRSEGRPGWISLYIGRIFRIGPLFLFAFMAMAAIVFVHSGPHLLVSLRRLLLELGVAFGLGLVAIRDVNGYLHSDLLLDGVTWTLQWEWFFYLSLPLLAATVVRVFVRRQHLIVVAIVLCVAEALRLRHVQPALPISISCIFLAGMLCASIQTEKLVPFIPDWIASFLMLGLIGSVFLTKSEGDAPSLLPLALIFYLVSSGCTLFGLLSCRPARRLGDISYGIYLLQGLTQVLFFRPAVFQRYAITSPLHHWLLTLAAAIVLVLLATATHVYLEQPGIRLGARLTRFVQERRALTLREA